MFQVIVFFLVSAHNYYKMKFVSHGVEKLLNTDYENFTSYLITSISIAKSIKGFNKKDLIRLEWLRDNTNEIIKTSMYKLDRKIDPSKVTDNPEKFDYPIAFKSDNIKNDEGDYKQFKITSDRIQDMMCRAIEEVASIMFSNFEQYNEEIIMPKSFSNKEDDFR